MTREPELETSLLRHTESPRPTAGAPSTFGQLLRARRRNRGLSLAQLAALLFFDKGHVSKIETDKRPPSVEFAQACDRVLDAGNTFETIASAMSATSQPHQAWPRPAQLPGAHRGFVGRGEYLDLLDTLLHGDNDTLGALVTVIGGPAGVGKTALAVQWAQRAVDRGHFEDGQLFVTLRDPWSGVAVEPCDLLGDMLRTLGVPAEQLPASLEQRSAAFRSLLHGRKVLVVLDDATDVRQISSLLPGSRGCAAVVTTRNRLPGLASQFGAITMTLPDIEYCHGTAADLVAHLKSKCDRPDLAEGDGTIRGGFDSFNAMFGEDATRLLWLLGRLPGTVITAAGAAAIAGIDEDRARMLLRELAGARLIRTSDEHRFQVNDLLRAYATELAKQHTEAG